MPKKSKKTAEPINVKSIIYSWLVDNGYDGVYSEGGECGCAVGKNFAPCDGYPPFECIPGYKQPCDCGEGCDFHIGPTKEKNR